MLNNYSFESIFKDELNYFIKFKRSMGLDYKYQVYELFKIDKILLKLNLSSKVITKETFDELTKRNDLRNIKKITSRFSKYMLNYI